MTSSAAFAVPEPCPLLTALAYPAANDLMFDDTDDAPEPPTAPILGRRLSRRLRGRLATVSPDAPVTDSARTGRPYPSRPAALSDQPQLE